MDWKKSVKYCIPPILLNTLSAVKGKKYFKQNKKLTIQNLELKNKHLGKRCFILGSGPSIKNQNLIPLKDEIVFALNNFYVHQDFNIIMSGEKSKYYITAPTHEPQLENEWKAWFEDMQNNISQKIVMILGLSRYKYNIRYLFKKYDLFKKHKIYWYFPGIITGDYYQFKPKNLDITKMIWSAMTISVYALIIAIYMGFKDIYLLGMDHNYFLYDDESQMRMYNSSIHQKNEFQRAFGDSFYVKEFLRQYKIFSQYELLRDNCKSNIYNASAGGILKVFPKVDFDKVISNK